MSSERARWRLMLLIGRPVLIGQWVEEDFPTRNITLQVRHRKTHQVHTYPVPPIFDAQAARQLLSSTDYSRLILHVSLLELDHQQCATILDGITTLVDNHPDQVNITLRLEYEMGNPEHRDALQQARAVLPRRFGCYLHVSPNVHIEATSDMSVKGDDGPPTEDD